MKNSPLKNVYNNSPENIINNNYFCYLYAQRLLLALKRLPFKSGNLIFIKNVDMLTQRAFENMCVDVYYKYYPIFSLLFIFFQTLYFHVNCMHTFGKCH